MFERTCSFESRPTERDPHIGFSRIQPLCAPSFTLITHATTYQHTHRWVLQRGALHAVYRTPFKLSIHNHSLQQQTLAPHLWVVQRGALGGLRPHRHILKQAHAVDGVDVAPPLLQAEHLRARRAGRVGQEGARGWSRLCVYRKCSLRSCSLRCRPQPAVKPPPG